MTLNLLRGIVTHYRYGGSCVQHSRHAVAAPQGLSRALAFTLADRVVKLRMCDVSVVFEILTPYVRIRYRLAELLKF